MDAEPYVPTPEEERDDKLPDLPHPTPEEPDTDELPEEEPEDGELEDEEPASGSARNQSGQWVSVLDSLPDDDVTVLLAVPAASDPVWLGFFSSEDGEWCWADGATVQEAVTHWMPLPELPAKSKDAKSAETCGCDDYARCIQILREIVKDGLGGRISRATWDSVMRELKNASKENSASQDR